MHRIDFDWLIADIKNKTVERPNKATSGTLSGHAAGEPFEKCVYHMLKDKYPDCVFKQYEYLNDIYLRNPKHITVEQKYALMESPTALFLLSRGDRATENGLRKISSKRNRMIRRTSFTMKMVSTI